MIMIKWWEKKKKKKDTSGFNYTHTMIRVKDPAESLNFYCNILGMKLNTKQHNTPNTTKPFVILLRGGNFWNSLL